MPEYKITGPDGQTYKITAPEGATEQDIIAYAQSNFAKQGTKKPEQSYVEGLGRNALQGLTFGYGDELLARIKSIGPSTYEENLKEERELTKEFAKENPWTSVGANIVGGLPTMLIPGVGSRKAKQGVKSIGDYAKEGAKTGAVYGSLYGSGVAETNPEDDMLDALVQRTIGGAKGAATGGVFGGALGGGIGSAAKAAPVVRDYLQRAKQPELASARQIANDMRSDGITPDDIYRVITPEIKTTGGAKLGQKQVDEIITRSLNGESAQSIANDFPVAPATIQSWVSRYKSEVLPKIEGANLVELARMARSRPGDVISPKGNMDQSLQAAARFPGKGRDIAGQRLLQRQLDQSGRIEANVEKSFGTKDFANYKDSVIKERQEKAGELYKALESDSPILATKELDKFMDHPEFIRAMDEAVRGEWLLGNLPAGQGIGEAITARMANQVQKRLRRMADTAWKSGNENAENLSILHKQFLDKIGDKFSGFREVREFYAHRMAREEALEAGSRVPLESGKTGQKFLEQFRSYQGRLKESEKEVRKLRKLIVLVVNPKEKIKLEENLKNAILQEKKAQEVVADFKTAFGKSILNITQSKRDINSLALPFDKKVVRTRIMQILGPKEGQRFLRAMNKEREGTDTLQYTFGNSVTADIMEKFAQMKEAADIGTALATGRFGKLAETLSKIVGRKMTEAQAERTVKALTENRPDVLRNILKEVEEANRFELMNQKTVSPLEQIIGPSQAPLQQELK